MQAMTGAYSFHVQPPAALHVCFPIPETGLLPFFDLQRLYAVPVADPPIHERRDAQLSSIQMNSCVMCCLKISLKAKLELLLPVRGGSSLALEIISVRMPSFSHLLIELSLLLRIDHICHCIIVSMSHVR